MASETILGVMWIGAALVNLAILGRYFTELGVLGVLAIITRKEGGS